MSWECRLPPYAENALDILSAAAEDATETTKVDIDKESGRSRADFTKEEASAVLAADEDFTVADAADALEVLFQRGYIYYVDDDIYITPTDD